jgi:leucyl aminopeptidase
MKITFSATLEEKGVLVLPVCSEKTLATSSAEYEKQTYGHLSKAMDAANFSGKIGEVVRLYAPAGTNYSQIILIGIGDTSALTLQKFEEIGGNIFKTVEKEINVVVDFSAIQKTKNIKPFEWTAHLAAGLELRSFKFLKYKTKNKQILESTLENVTFKVSEHSLAETIFNQLQAVTEGVFLTRTLVSEPPNVLYPESMGDIAKTLSKIGLKVEVYNKKDLERLGMGGLLAVGQGSVKEPKLIVIQWLNGPRDQKPVALVGKGITFDTGGISIKPAANMEHMKYDMGGSGVVIGLMKTLALRKAKVNVVGVMAMAENMPSGSAYRPADIVTTMSGQTIEVQNTDAEGRVILADALWYTQDRFKPQTMIDLATLTGAVGVALGDQHAGLMSNNHELAAKLLKAGDDVNEPMWRLPLTENYDKFIDSDVADVKNISAGSGAGTITAGQFLQRFVNNTPWAHIDIAFMAWDKIGNKSLCDKGATGYGVRLLNKYIKDSFE